MMKYYEIKYRNRDHIGTLYSLDTAGDNTIVDIVEKDIENESLPVGTEISMEIDPRTGTGKKRLGDLVFWQKGTPLAHVLIVSYRLLNFLTTLNIPVYKAYKVNILNVTIKEEYFIIHLLGDIYDAINYSEQIFYKQNMRTEANEGYLEKGFALNKEDFIQKRSDIIESQSQTLFFDTIVYKKEYDLLWAIGKLFIVNEDTKRKIEEQSFVLDFIEFDKYEITFKA